METLLDEHRDDKVLPIDAILSEVSNKFVDLWQAEAGLEDVWQGRGRRHGVPYR